MSLSERCVKRVLKELDAYGKSDHAGYTMSFREDCLDTLHFIVRGLDGDFEGGEYIFQIKISPDYPFSPPVIRCLTPSGRFETEKTFCLSITHYHSEKWSPLVTIEKIIYSVMSVFSDPEITGVGIRAFPPGERRALAMSSREYNRQYFGDILSNEKE
jgi:ubiquitin-conjugating enzyme E2 J2